MLSDSLWKLLLKLKEKVYSFNGPVSNILLSNEGITINPSSQNNSEDILLLIEKETIPDHWDCTQLFTKKNGLVEIIKTGQSNPAILNKLQLYLPFCIAPLLVKKQSKTLSISHFAQSVDGFIATKTKHSKWIGNQENLIHAHRLRAMVDAVIIGNNTLKDDLPQLTVRHVEGENPTRVIIGNSRHSESSLIDCCDKKIIRFTTDNFPPNKNVEYIKVETDNKKIPTSFVLETLYKKGIYSVLIEGGAFTSSLFQMEGNIDMIQLHIAPLLFGSGIKAFNLPDILKVEEGLSFEHHLYHPMGNAIMFTGYVNG